MKKTFDTIVVGVGGMGSSTCYQLAKRGQKVLGLEQFDIPHTYGSSHGHTRIIRLAYYEDPSYVPLLRRAYELWAEIEAVSGKKILYKNASVDVGPADGEIFQGSLASCKKHAIPHEVLTGKELNQRFPGYNVPDDFKAIYQKDGGFLVPEKATTAFVEAAHQYGATIHAREKVLSWRAVDNGVIVKTNRNEYQAGKLVFTAGAWNAQLLPILSGLAIAERQVLAWLQPLEPALFTPERFPVFNMEIGGERYYGFPIYGIPGFKFGKYCHLKERGEPESFNREPTAKDEAILRAFSSKVFPKGNGPTMSLKTCMFTNSPDDHFILDVHPVHPQVIMGAGFSGHGYKFASVIGEVMADLAITGDTRHNIELLRLKRFEQFQ